MLQLQSALGVVALLAIAWALGENRRAVSIRQAAIGLVVTLVTALVLIKVPLVAKAFGAINDAVSTIAAAVGEDAGTLEEVYEPFLVQNGFLQRTPRGRVATAQAYRHFGFNPPNVTNSTQQQNLF